MGRQITLNELQEVVVVTREEERLSTDKISVDSVTDDGTKVVSKVSFYSSHGLTKLLVLWEGQDYVNIGDWTDAQVDARIKELLQVF
jgi:hypothetical protein